MSLFDIARLLDRWLAKGEYIVVEELKKRSRGIRIDPYSESLIVKYFNAFPFGQDVELFISWAHSMEWRDSRDAMLGAAIKGNVGLIKYLHYNGFSEINESTVLALYKFGHYDLFIDFTNQGFLPSFEIVFASIDIGDFEGTKWFLQYFSNRGVRINYRIILRALNYSEEKITMFFDYVIDTAYDLIDHEICRILVNTECFNILEKISAKKEIPRQPVLADEKHIHKIVIRNAVIYNSVTMIGFLIKHGWKWSNLTCEYAAKVLSGTENYNAIMELLHTEGKHLMNKRICSMFCSYCKKIGNIGIIHGCQKCIKHYIEYSEGTCNCNDFYCCDRKKSKEITHHRDCPLIKRYRIPIPCTVHNISNDISTGNYQLYGIV